jgi:hypothetical protein
MGRIVLNKPESRVEVVDARVMYSALSACSVRLRAIIKEVRTDTMNFVKYDKSVVLHFGFQRIP